MIYMINSFEFQETVVSFSLKTNCKLEDVRGWQFLTVEVAETLCMVYLPPEEHISKKKNVWVTDLSESHIL